MSFLLTTINTIKFDLGGDGDFSDKLSCRYSVVLLMVFCSVVATRQFVSEPIACWVPGTFTMAMRYYTDTLCWISNTYFVPLRADIPNKEEDINPKAMINYYQWIPLVLIVQAFMFYVPQMVWIGQNRSNGCELKHLVKLFSGGNTIDANKRKAYLDNATLHLDKFFSSQGQPYKRRMFEIFAQHLCIGRRFGNKMTVTYIYVKLLFIANCLGQLAILTYFIGNGYPMYGFDKAKEMWSNAQSEDSPIFPRVTLCSYYIREFGGNTHRYTVQCILPLNIFNEKIYLFIWFWLIFVTAWSVVNLFQLLFKLVFTNKYSTIMNCLKMLPDYKSENIDRSCVKRFAENYLKVDGILILLLLGKNINEVVLWELTEKLYKNYHENRYQAIPTSDSYEENDSENKTKLI